MPALVRLQVCHQSAAVRASLTAGDWLVRFLHGSTSSRGHLYRAMHGVVSPHRRPKGAYLRRTEANAWQAPSAFVPLGMVAGIRRRIPMEWHTCGMNRIRLSTTVDAELLGSARTVRPGITDAALIDEALGALLARYRSAEVDASYTAYDEPPTRRARRVGRPGVVAARSRRLVSPLPTRGEVWWCETAEIGRRPVVVLSRDAAIPRLRRALVAPCTTTIRGLASEVVLEPNKIRSPGARRPTWTRSKASRSLCLSTASADWRTAGCARSA